MNFRMQQLVHFNSFLFSFRFSNPVTASFIISQLNSISLNYFLLLLEYRFSIYFTYGVENRNPNNTDSKATADKRG